MTASSQSRCTPSNGTEGYTDVIPARKSGSGEMSGQESPAERLRRAADLVERRAADNRSDAWEVPHVRAALAPWVALMSPTLAEPLAAWLRGAADAAELLGADCRALAVADAILGGDA